jgi:transcriptional regulator with XRE-family HTH domain
MEQKIGRKIKKLRELRNYSQDYMAAQLGISQSTYSQLETEDAGLSPDRLEKIATLLQITVSDIENFDDRLIFQVTNHNPKDGSGHAYVNNNNVNTTDTDNKIIKLQEDKIRLLEEQVQMLKEKIKNLEK